MIKVQRAHDHKARKSEVLSLSMEEGIRSLLFTSDIPGSWPMQVVSVAPPGFVTGMLAMAVMTELTLQVFLLEPCFATRLLSDSIVDEA